MTEYPDDDIREALRAARDQQSAIPRDVVPQPAVTDEQLLRWHDAGQGSLVDGGEVTPDGVGPSTTTPVAMTDLLPAEQKARLEHLLAQRDIEETP